MNAPKYLSRGIDYLGNLGSKLRDLQGYGTLAHELIQNADDAANATSISFDVTGGAFVVDNDGVFSDCGREEVECPWKADGIHGHRCDFHRFRHIAAGDKRGEAGTTGAFGIGFIATYQITDKPELISVGRHWILHEDRPEDERIEVCPGCPKCAQSDLPGTRFIFPWALNADSDLRRALRAEPVLPDGPKRLTDELVSSLPVAMLFLKRLRSMQIKTEGRTVDTIQRLDESDSLILSHGSSMSDQIWHLIRGDFSAVASNLRGKHQQIEDKRSSTVTLAIPASPLRTGLLCACLPTEQDTGLPFHINADFFPTNDRKRVILAEDYQSEWNREALRAAGRALGSAVGRLPGLLGASRFWGLMATLKEVADRAQQEQGEPVYAEFWKQVASKLRLAPVIQTTTAEWTTPAGTCLLLQKEEANVIRTLEALGVRVVHESLRPFQSLLRSEAVGIPILDVEKMCNALAAAGLSRRTEQGDMPAGLDTEPGRAALFGEIALLLDRQQRTPKLKADDERRLRDVALAPGRDGAFWPCGEIYFADEVTVALFERLGLGIPYVTEDRAFAPLNTLCRRFNAAAAVEALRIGGTHALEDEKQKDRLLRQLFEWFENRRQEILGDEGLMRRLAALPLFPSAGTLRPLAILALPGNFNDPLGLAEIVDLSVLGGRREFLRDLGMPDLDFLTYAVFRLPVALTNPAVTSDKRRAAVILLAGHIGELKDNESARLALTAAPLVECTDGEFRQAQTCYFDSAIVRECLGAARYFAVLPSEHAATVRDLFAWLGVATEPRFEDIARFVHVLGSQLYSASAAQQVQNILGNLSRRIDGKGDMPDLSSLKNERWLPARGRADRWYRADELYVAYQDYLFETQALFLDLNVNVQRMGRALFEFLGVHITPPANLVVKHLIHCAVKQVPVNTAVYRFLNENADDPALGQLVDKKCLWLGDAYHAPNQVFWGEHPFGRYRWRLGEELRNYGNLLTRLRTRETPGYQDALAVIKEISVEFGSGNKPLDDDSLLVLMSCWRTVNRALNEGAVSKADVVGLRAVKCVPKPSRVLNPPEWMFFENRAGLAAKFGEFLASNVIPRPLDAGNALALAGVRMLGSAVDVELLGCGDPVEDLEMLDRVRVRRSEVARVLDAQGSGPGTGDVLDRLTAIRFHASESIEIRYRLHVFNRELESPAEQVPALYQAEPNTLMFTLREGRVPWAAIARELTVALFPDEDPGRFAAGLKEALAPESAAEAAAILDELGFARLDASIQESPELGTPAGALGAIDSVTGGMAGPDGVDPPTDQVGEPLTTEEALRRLLGGDTLPPTAPVQPPGSEQSGTGGSSPTGKPWRTGKKSRRPVLRTFLPAPDVDGLESTEDAEMDEEPRSPVDIAGVQRVLAHELVSARTPKEMPHKHEGYDIESRDSSGKVVRYIEVKSFSGQWAHTYAVLSRPQFNKARELGQLFWLYVVERAESEDFKVHRIQNPALLANHFMFDDGWHALAESAPALEESK